MRQG
ncbi:unnamed protein product [Macrosiphum euphorbiae]|jgi:hypothetical protein